MASSSGLSTSSSNYYPRDLDETDSVIKLFGRNESAAVRLMGWTNDFPVDFLGLNPNLFIQPLDPDDPEMMSMAMKNGNGFCSLKHLADIASVTREALPKAVVVHVFAKKKVDLIIKNYRALLMGTLIVGDDTGSCSLHVANETIQTLYQRVEVGTTLLIKRGAFKTRYDKEPKFPGVPESHRLNLELKIRIYDCRSIWRLIILRPNLFPPYFVDNRKLWLPSEVEITFCGTEPPEEEQANLLVDITGVITYVGRLERVTKHVGDAEFEDGKIGPLTQYTVFRWIEIIDLKVSKPIPIQLFLNENNWKIQENVTPGTMVVITNLSTYSSSAKFSQFSLRSSVYSQVYLNETFSKLAKYMPLSYNKVVLGLIGGKERDIIQTDCCLLSAGGNYAQPFANELEFSKHFYSSELGRTVDGEERNPRPQPLLGSLRLPMARREVQRIQFVGKVLKIRERRDAGGAFIWRQNSQELVDFEAKLPETSKFATFSPISLKLSWYTFTRLLPEKELNTMAEVGKLSDKTRQYQKLTEAYKTFCKPLLMPVPAQNDYALQDLPISDGPPYFVITLLDLGGEKSYTCIWKRSRNLPFEKMEEKLRNSREKLLLFVLDVYFIEELDPKASKALGLDSDSIYEIILQDFTEPYTPSENGSEMSEESGSPSQSSST